jgi:hypothetical protein
MRAYRDDQRRAHVGRKRLLALLGYEFARGACLDVRRFRGHDANLRRNRPLQEKLFSPELRFFPRSCALWRRGASRRLDCESFALT